MLGHSYPGNRATTLCARRLVSILLCGLSSFGEKALSEKRDEKRANNLNQQAQLFEQLSALPNSEYAHQFRGQFGKQLELISIRDALTQTSLDIPQNAQVLDAESIAYEAEQWHGLNPKTIQLKWLSPVRISTPKPTARAKTA